MWSAWHLTSKAHHYSMPCPKCWATCYLQEGFPQALSLATSAAQAGAVLSFKTLSMLMMMCFEDGNAAYGRDLFWWTLQHEVIHAILKLFLKTVIVKDPCAYAARACHISSHAWQSEHMHSLTVSPPMSRRSITYRQCQIVTWLLCRSAITRQMHTCWPSLSSKSTRRWEITLALMSCGITTSYPMGWRPIFCHGESYYGSEFMRLCHFEKLLGLLRKQNPRNEASIIAWNVCTCWEELECTAKSGCLTDSEHLDSDEAAKTDSCSCAAGRFECATRWVAWTLSEIWLLMFNIGSQFWNRIATSNAEEQLVFVICNCCRFRLSFVVESYHTLTLSWL